MKKTNLNYMLLSALALMLLLSARSYAVGFGSDYDAPVTDNLAADETTAADTSIDESAVNFGEFHFSFPQPLNGLPLTNILESKIQYPLSVSEKLIEGRVLALCTIDKNGNVTKVDIIKSPDAELAKEVVNSLKSIVFKPAMQNGFPLSHTMLVPVTFKLL